MTGYEKYVELKNRLLQFQIAKRELEKRIEETEIEKSNLIEKLKEEGLIEICESCGEPLCPEDGRCYNQYCEEYDPLGQYFD